MISAKEPILQCRNTACDQKASLKEAKMTYKSCHYCFTFYCSRHCRQEHWVKHKEKCIYAKAVSVAKQVLRTIYNDHVALDGLSKIALKSVDRLGRGAVRIQFATIANAESFLQGGLKDLAIPPIFISVGDLDHDMKQIASKYRTEDEIILDVKIDIGKKERIFYNRPYRTNSSFISSGSRMTIPSIPTPNPSKVESIEV